MLARIIAEDAHSRTGIDIHPGAEIGERFFIDHGTGVVIGETAIVGRNVRLYQARHARREAVRDRRATGALRKDYPRHPIVEDDVVIYAGATILGRVDDRPRLVDRRQRLADAERRRPAAASPRRSPATRRSTAGTEFEIGPSDAFRISASRRAEAKNQRSKRKRKRAWLTKSNAER